MGGGRAAEAWRRPFAVALALVALAPLAGPDAAVAGQVRQGGAPEASAFTHDDHETLECTTCHGTETGHGQLRFRAPQGCRSCHHDASRYPSCESCHEAVGSGEPVLTSLQPVLSTGPGPARPVPFDHGAHETVACGECHTDPAAASTAPTGCTACHAEHHRPTASCTTCHISVTAPEHPVAVHEGCGGAGCHEEAPDLTTWSREACLVCHTDQRDHRVDEGSCAACHAVPAIGS